MIKIRIIDNIVSEVQQGKELIKPILSYPAVFYRPGQYRKIKTEYQKCLMFGKGNKLIYNGWLSRIEEYCGKQNIELIISGSIERIGPSNPPCVPGVVLRGYQEEGINKGIQDQRGVYLFGTGLGKTIISIGTISAFKNKKILILCPSLDLVQQFHSVLKEYKIKCSIYSKDNKKIHPKITISNIQIFKSVDLIKYSDFWDMILVDECHKAFAPEGTCEKILSQLLAPLRFGLTGTIPKIKEKNLMVEGLLGPIIMNKSAKIGIEEGYLSKPKTKLIPVPMDKRIKDSCKTYQQFYDKGIVNNDQRNKLIASEVEASINEGKSVLIFIVNIDHLQALSKTFFELGIRHEKVWGDTKITERNKIKKDLGSKKNLCVISSVVWAEGVDIPSLDEVINAGGQKAEEALLQRVGRALRKTENKKVCGITDFLDPYPYLSGHSIQRLSVYVRMGWL